MLRRLAHPFWFQSFGVVMGMDWHPALSEKTQVRKRLTAGGKWIRTLGPARTGDGFEPLLVAPPKRLIRGTGGYHSEYDHIAGVSVMPRIPQPSHPANWRVELSVSGSLDRVAPGNRQAVRQFLHR